MPFNERCLEDALDNGITCCLKSLQASNPSLLLTAQQLKRVERDARYAPYAATAIGSVIRRSRERALYGDTMRRVSGWDDGGDATTLASIVERRLRLVISDEYKEAKKREEQEDRLKQREEQRKQSRKDKVKTDDLLSDCFESDGSRTPRHRKKSLYETLYGRKEQLGRDCGSSSSLSSGEDERTIDSCSLLSQSQQSQQHDLANNGFRISLGVDGDSSSSFTQMRRSRDDTSRTSEESFDDGLDDGHDGLDASPAKILRSRCDEHKENHENYENSPEFSQSQKSRHMNDGYESEPSAGVVLDSSDRRQALRNIPSPQISKHQQHQQHQLRSATSNQRRSHDGFDSDSSLSSISQPSEEETRQKNNTDGTNEDWWDSSVLGY